MTVGTRPAEVKEYALIAVITALIIAAGLIGYRQYLLVTPPAKITLQLPGELRTGQTIDVPLRVSTRTAINAAEFYFAFPSELIEVTTVNQTGSFFQLWIKDQPAFNNETGLLSLAGGLPKPGFVGRNGLVATVTVRAIKPGSGTISLNPEQSRILANDGLGTKVEATFEPISFTIK